MTSAESVQLESITIPLNLEQPDNKKVGALIYRGGLHLTSHHPSFGGFSALGSSASGGRLLAITDQGYRLELIPEYDPNGNITGISTADLSPLADIDGEVFSSKYSSDIESLSPGANGEVIVSLERQHRLLVYSPDDPLPMPLPPPEGLEHAPMNGGIEALTLLVDGRLLAITQSLGGAEERVAWISDRNGWSPLTYSVSDGFDPTGAATLPDGDVLVLERYFTRSEGNAARIRRIPADTIQPGAVLNGLLLAEFREPVNIDNMEGIAVRPADQQTGKDGKVIVYLISDDNFDPDEQRTLLLMFEMEI